MGLVPVNQAGEDNVTEGIKVLQVTKEVGLSDRDFRDQGVQLRRASQRIAQHVKIGRAVLYAYASQAAADATSQICILVGVICEAGRFHQVLFQARIEGVV